MAIICTSLHVAPLQREFLGFTPERGNFFGLAPDRQWLAFTQYASENSLKTKGRDGQTVLFDGIAFPSNPDDGATRQVWSSFPIKYAARRQRFSTGMAAAAPAAPLPPPPSGGGGGGSPTGGVGGF
jgi:hypothetical protein